MSSLYGVSYVGGIEVSTRLLYRALEPRIARPRFFTTRNTQVAKEIAYPIPRGHWIYNRFLILGNALVDRFIAINLEVAIKQDPPDIICTCDEFIIPAAVRVARRLSLLIVAIVRNNLMMPKSVLSHRFPVIAPILLPIWHRRGKTLVKSCQQVDLVITNSEYIRQSIIASGVDKNKVKALYVAVVPKWACSSGNKSLRSKIIVLAPGRIEKGKGFDTMVKAMKLVLKKRRRGDIRLIIVGDGYYRRVLQRLVCSLELDPYVELIGKVPFERMEGLYRSCNFVLFAPRDSEPFGRVALEAMAYGKAVLASDIGGVPEVVQDGVTGLLLPPESPAHWATAILKLAEDEEMRMKMGEAGRKQALAKFDINNIADRLVELLEAIVSRHREHKLN